MSDDRVASLSSNSYRAFAQIPEDGRGYNWTTDIHTELPVKMKRAGPGSELPITVSQLFLDAVREGGDRPCLFVERDGQKLSWTWNEYYKNSILVAKALNKLGVSRRSAVAIMGFNSPEWTFTFIGSILNDCVSTGIYITN